MGYIKFAILLIFNILSCVRSGHTLAIPFSALELLTLFIASNSVYKKNRIWGYITDLILCLIFGAQTFVLYFSGEFISSLMLENVNMTSNLGKELIVYFTVAIPAIIVVALPATKFINLKSRYSWCISAIYLATSIITATSIPGQPQSPIISIINTSLSIGKTEFRRIFRKHIDPQIIFEQFKRDSIAGNGSRGMVPLKIEKPNIIIIFTEGMSAEVLDSYNNLGLGATPATDSLKAHSLVFDNYFNHTAATFRGLRGQTYSSHQDVGGYYEDNRGLGQLNNEQISKKTSTGQVSLIDIFKKNGYMTYFVNPEPNNPQTTSYLRSFHTEELLSSEAVDALSDKEIFELLGDKIVQCHKSTQPFLICSYNLGTHHGFDSPHIKYGDGKNPILNKFHNYDYWLGKFLKRMERERIFDDTILVFTSDHASYPAPEYVSTFKSKQTFFIAQTPLFIYTTGITPRVLDAEGRNSLTLAPTIIDMLDNPEMRHETNWFLGNSLFTENSRFDKTSAMGSEFFYTGNKRVEVIKKGGVISDIETYYEISLN